MKLSEKIRMLREEEGFSPEELAKRTDLPVQVIYAFENGKEYPKHSRTYTKLAEALGTNVRFLMEDDTGYAEGKPAER